MEHRMTSWTLNIVLASMTAAAVFLPAPDEIRKAIEYGRVNHPIVITIDPKLEGAVIESTSALGVGTEALVSYQPAVDCLESLSGEPVDRVSGCVPDLFQQVETFDRMASAQIALGGNIYPDPKIEQARSALIKLCRAAWAADLPGVVGTSPEDCTALMVGVAY